MSDADEREVLLREMLGEPDVPLVESAGRSFEAWHRPRKQFVRRKQWLAELLRLMNDLDLRDSDFNYLSLPGDDLLDLHFLRSELCETRNLNFRFLGFNPAAHPSNPQQARLDQVLYGLKRLPQVDQISHVYPDDLRTIGRAKSVQRKRVASFGPFHAINIDLCDGLAREQPSDSSSNLFDAIEVILEAQSRTTSDSLLFITTRMDDQQVNQENMNVLSSILAENILNCAPFRAGVEKEWSILNWEDVNTLGVEDQFMLGLSKWMLKAASRSRLSARVASVMTYKVVSTNTVDDLVSIAIRLTPNRVISPDPYGLSGSAADLIDECEQAAPLPARIRGGQSVDRVLDDQNLYDQYADESAELLRQVGYDVSEYRAWLQLSGG